MMRHLRDFIFALLVATAYWLLIYAIFVLMVAIALASEFGFI